MFWNQFSNFIHLDLHTINPDPHHLFKATINLYLFLVDAEAGLFVRLEGGGGDGLPAPALRLHILHLHILYTAEKLLKIERNRSCRLRYMLMFQGIIWTISKQ